MSRLKRERMPVRCIRISEDLWFQAMDYAHAEDKDLSEVIREFLKRYVNRRRRERAA